MVRYIDSPPELGGIGGGLIVGDSIVVVLALLDAGEEDALTPDVDALVEFTTRVFDCEDDDVAVEEVTVPTVSSRTEEASSSL